MHDASPKPTGSVLTEALKDDAWPARTYRLRTAGTFSFKYGRLEVRGLVFTLVVGSR